MNKISFENYNFKKFKNKLPKNIILLSVRAINYDDIPDELIKYDTKHKKNKYYKLDKKSRCIMLILFDPDNHNMFSKIEKFEEFKYQYYKERLLQKFDVIYYKKEE